MDDELKEALEISKQELTHLYYRWIMYVQIFGTNSHRIDIVNQTASNFLQEFQWLIIDNMVLSISKLTDAAEMRKNTNLSLSFLINKVAELGDEDLTKELSAILEQLKDSIEHFRDIRNKRIAHNDLATAKNKDTEPLPGVSRKDVNVALQYISDFLNKIEQKYLNSTTAYDMTILPLNNDGRSVLIRLQKSLMYDELEKQSIIERQRWKSLGNIDEKKA